MFDNSEEPNKTEGNTNTGGKSLDGFQFGMVLLKAEVKVQLHLKTD